MSGVAHCPYNPLSNVTSLIADSGEYYVGTPTDFSSSDFAIARFVSIYQNLKERKKYVFVSKQ